MEFNRIPTIMQRYTFDAIMNECHKCAIHIMGVNKIDIYVKDAVYPWELDVIVLFGLLVKKKYSFQTFEGKNYRKFIEIVNCIRNYHHPLLNPDNVSSDWAEKFMMVTGLTQFSVQEDSRYKFYRYNYFFNFQNKNIDLKSIFKDKFKVSYSDFRIPVQFIYLLYSTKKLITQDPEHKILKYIVKKFAPALEQLVINRNDFIYKQSEILKNDIDNYYYSFKYFYQYPFIRCGDDKIILPLPYLLLNATTDSLLYRITEGNNRLRQVIGKEVIESYLCKILIDSNAYDEVFPEQKYKNNGTVARSPDVLTRKDDYFVLFDSKSSVPKITLREFDNSSLDKTIQIYSDSIVQIFKQIKHFNLYNPFKNRAEIDYNNIFGIITLLEDSNIFRNKIYDRAAKTLGITVDSDDYKFLQSNIMILALKDIEKFSFNSVDFIDELVERRDDSTKWNDMTVNISKNKKTLSWAKEFDDFISNCHNDFQKIIEELKNNKLLDI